MALTILLQHRLPRLRDPAELDATTAISRASYGMDKFALVVDDRIAIAIAIQTNKVPSP